MHSPAVEYGKKLAGELKALALKIKFEASRRLSGGIGSTGTRRFLMRQQQQELDIVLSASGLKKIEEQLERLKTVDRKRVAERIRESKSFGEFSENSEYEDAKNEQAFIEGRIDELTAILRHANVLDEQGIPVDHVGVGSVVRVRDLQTLDEWEYRLVGPVEADPAEDSISNESPVGRALMGSRVGDIVEVRIPAGTVKYEIVDIHK